MTADTYNKLVAPLRARPRLVAALRGANSVLTATGYVAYLALLATIALGDPWDPWRLALYVAIPGVGFVTLSFLRRRWNAPRPADALGIEPLLHRSGAGSSFPSRHVFSAFTIAACWLGVAPVVGVALLVASALLAVIRVVGGVHWPRDVIAGALAGIAVGTLTLLV